MLFFLYFIQANEFLFSLHFTEMRDVCECASACVCG